MRNELMIFEGHEVEVIEVDNKVLFNPYHVGECLDLAESSVRNYLAKMNSKQAILLKNSDVREKDIRKLNNAGEKFITESGVYKLVFRSQKPNAEDFTDWIADEVLPTLRKTGSYEIPKKEKKPTSKPQLPSVNMAARIMKGVYKEAGVDPLYIAVAIDNLYKKEAGIDFGVPLITDESMSKLYDCTEIAKELGITSKTGNPHNKAVSAIIQQLDIREDETVTTAFSRNGHDDVTVQYKPSVFDKVKSWLADSNYPTVIHCNGKNYTVTYKVVEVA